MALYPSHLNADVTVVENERKEMNPDAIRMWMVYIQGILNASA
jgi:hypothetical protein